MRAYLKTSPTVRYEEQPDYADAGYGVAGVDFVKVRDRLSTLTLEIEIEGTVTGADVERITKAALDAAQSG